MRRLLPLLFILFTLFEAYTQKKVSAEYKYVATEQESPAEAKRTALQRAKIQALADAFGTTISQENKTHIENSSGKSSSHFVSIGESEVKGEWIEDTRDPEYEIVYENNVLIITVRVWGKAREIKSNAVDLDIAILRNGTDRKYESEEFKDGDQLYLAFKAPIKGYAAIYYIDNDTKDAFCLMPYSGDTDGQMPIMANREYVFFSPEMCEEKSERALVDEILLPGDKKKKFDEIIVLFSHNPFVKALDNEYESDGNLLPRGLPVEDFQRWLTKCRMKDKDMVTVKKLITIAEKH